MAKKRFDFKSTMEEVNSFIQAPKEDTIRIGDQTEYNNHSNKEEQPTPAFAPETKTESGVGESNPTAPDVKFKRNITLSEEMLWRLNYIKERKNKTRAKGDKFVTIDQLMFEMVQFALDEKFGSTKKKFLESKEDEEDFL